MHEMLALPSFLGFLLPLPSMRENKEPLDPAPRRHRAMRALRLSPYILRDVGMEDYDLVAGDPRWTRRPDLER